MISIQITSDAEDAKAFLVSITGKMDNRRDLNEALAIRLRRELKAHFVAKNQVPNKMGAAKTGFWGKVADGTEILEITDTGATIQVDDERFNIQLFGGTILPKTAKFLTIPLVAEADKERTGLLSESVLDGVRFFFSFLS